MRIVGMLFLVCAIAAAAVAQQPASPELPPTLAGTVRTIEGTIVSIDGVRVDVRTASITTSRGAGTPADLRVGARVTAVLSSRDVAKSVIVEPAARLSGTVESATSTSITLAGKTIALDGRTVFAGWAGQKLLRSSADLARRQNVMVDASINGEAWTAERVWGNDAPPAPPKARPRAAGVTIEGKITAADGFVYTVDKTRVVTSPQTKMTGKPAIGDAVVVVGIRASDGSVLAASLTKR